MAYLGDTFDAAAVEPLNAYEILPPGKYLAHIVASEMRVTKDGNGQYLHLELDILDGQCAGRKIFDRLNLVNSNPETVQIARRTLSSICRAVGKLQVSNSDQLHLIPMIADVRVRPPKGTYGESNAIRYLPRNATPSPGITTTEMAIPVAAPILNAPHVGTPPANGLPWKRQA